MSKVSEETKVHLKGIKYSPYILYNYPSIIFMS